MVPLVKVIATLLTRNRYWPKRPTNGGESDEGTSRPHTEFWITGPLDVVGVAVLCRNVVYAE